MTKADITDRIMTLAKQDKEYCRRLEILRIAENTLCKVETEMTTEQRDAVWDFWGACSFVDDRLLEIACDKILQLETQHNQRT